MATGNGEITWDLEKLTEYFTACQKKYNTFLSMSDALILKLKAFVDDDTHTGPEAEASKAFIEQSQIPMVEDLVWVIQEFMTKQDNLLQNYKDEMPEADNARMKLSRLDDIVEDFKIYNDNFVTVSEDIEAVYQGLVSECSIAGVEFTQPMPDNSKEAFDSIATSDKTSGIVPETRDNFKTFNETHANEITGSEIDEFLAVIESNLKGFLELTGAELKDIVLNFTDTSLLPWYRDPSEVLDEATKKEYDAYMQSMSDYLNGKKERCEVYKYDPVNMCSGNYINEHEDLKIGGLYPLTFKRFYNAIPSSGDSFVLGRGWSTSYSEHLTKDDEGIHISYEDGSLGLYKEIIIKGKIFYEEIHGEPGLLSEVEDSDNCELESKIDNDKFSGSIDEIDLSITKSKKAYILKQDSGAYKKFDKDGYLVELGDNNGVTAQLFYTNIKMVDSSSDRHNESDTGTDGRITDHRSQVKRIAAIKTPGSASFLFNYDEYGNIVTLSDHTGRVVKYTYNEKDGSQVLASVTYADGTKNSYSYSEDGRISEVANARGITAITNIYDSQGRTIKQSFPDGGVMTYDYDDKKRTTTATEQNGNKVVYEHDSKMRHTGTRYYDGSERYTYNNRNQKISYTNKLGYTTRYTYDNRGHLTSIIDPMGHKTCMTYNADGKLMALKDPKGNSYKYTYDIHGNLFEIKDPLGNKKRFYYTGRYLKKVKDEEGNITLLSHDAEGNISCITDPEGVKTFYKYDALGRVTETSDIAGNTKKYTYDEADRITSVTDALGNLTSYEYNESGKVTKITNPDGTSKTWEYNIIGKLCKVTDEVGRVTKIDYNSMGKEEKITLPNGGIINYEYDPLMRLTKMTDPEGRTRGYKYNSNGNVIEELIAGETTAFYSYDKLGNRTSIKDAEGNTTIVEYDVQGNPVKVIDPNGNVCKAEYDAIGRVVSRTDELGNIAKLEYTATGKVKSKTDFSGKKIEYSYDKRGKIINIFFNGSLKEHFIYDEMGRLSEKSYPDGLKVKCTYTANNQISHIETSTGRTIDYVYDSIGRCISQNDCGNSTHYAYTETGNLEKITDAEGNITEYTYNALDILSSVYRHGNEDKNMSSIDGEKLHITSYEHDSSGKLTCITDALGQKELYEYDNFGRLKTKTDRDKLTTSYSYTKMGQLSEIVYADGKTVKMSYDALGKLSELVDWMGKTSIVSDALGRVVKVTDFNNRTIEYEYTPFGKRSAVIYSDGRRVCYQYDENLQLIKLVNENGTEIDETDYEYDEFGRLTAKIFPNGASSRYEYYQGGLLKSLINNDVNGILDSYTYEYNSVGLKTKVTRSRRGMEDISGQYNYIYDCLNRIKSILFNGSSIKKYSYDAFGNRSQMEENHNGKVLTTTYSYDITDRLRESKEYSFESTDPNYSDSIIPIEKRYTYDARGNMTGIIRDGVKTKSYFFDATGMMTGASDIERGNITYSYNGLGFRVKSERPEEKIEYLCDITREAYNLLERTVNGVTESYVYDRNVVSFSRKNESSYYLQDDLGSTNWITGTDGTVYESYAYEDFGKQIDKYTKDIKTGRRLRNLGYEKKGNIIQPFAFTGYQRDEISELYYAQARYYNQDIGRFVAEDQERGLLFFPDSQNHYIYCYNCVFDYVDLNGRAPIIFPSDPILRMALSEILHNGNTAHKDIEADLMLKYGDEYNIETNVFIEGSRPNTGTTDNGFADLVMNPVGTNNYYIYEIKSDKNTDGITQLGEYVEGLKNAILKDLGIGKFKEIDKDSNVYYGNLNIPETTIPSSRKGYTLTYWSDADGMIYYHWNKEPQKQKQTQTAKAPATQKATGFARVCQGIYGAGEMLAGAACYTFCGLLVLDDGTVVGVADDPAAFAAGAAGTYLWIDGWNKIIGNCPY